MPAEITFDNFFEHKVKTNETLDLLAKKAGITWQQLATFNWGTSQPKQINECLHEFVGCRHLTKNGKNYMFNSKDSPGIVFIPVKSPHYKLQTGQTHTVQVIRPRLKSDIEVETVDEYLDVIGNVPLVLTRQEGGPEVEITTDGTGYGFANGILSGHYRVQVKGGGPAYFLNNIHKLKSDDPNDEMGHFEEAIIDTRHRVEALTQLVINRNTSLIERKRRRLHKKTYTQHKNRKVKGRGTETVDGEADGKTLLIKTALVDNLALLARWNDHEIDVSDLVSSVLPDFISARDAATGFRGFYVWVIEPTVQPAVIMLYNSSGLLEGAFPLEKKLKGLGGAYSIYENVAGRLFVDMMSKTYGVGVEGAKTYLDISELVSDRDRRRFLELQNKHALKNEVPIVYFLWTGRNLEWLALHRGLAPLEEYPADKSLNSRVHSRNRRVCQRISALYDSYVAGYVKRVQETRNEQDLRKLGPPWAPAVLAVPGTADHDQMWDLYGDYNLHQLRAWKAIAVQLNHFANHGKGRLTEGAPFISIKAKYEIGATLKGKEGALIGLAGLPNSGMEPLPTAVEIESSMTFQFNDEEITSLRQDEAKSKAAWEGEFESGGHERKFGIEYKKNLDPKKRDEWEVTVKTGPLELEANKDGTRKIAIEALPEVWAESQFNPREAKFEGGLKIETEAILRIIKKLPVKNKRFSHFFEKYGERIIPKEISIHAGFVGAREETLLALISNAPGFFERRSLDELVESQWNELNLDEQIHLSELGWNQCSWDLKVYVGSEPPKTMEQEWSELSAQQKVALVHLGFYDVEEYHETIEEVSHKKAGWKDAVEKMQCSSSEEGEQKGGSTLP